MNRGFTIVEVLLFISISGLIVLMVMTSFNSSITANRRIDTNRSFEAAIEAEYTSVRSGTVMRGLDGFGKVPNCTGPGTSFPGNSNNCVVVGKLLKIRQSTNTFVSSYNVVANINPTTPCSDTGVRAVITCHSARVLDMRYPANTFGTQWSSQISRVDFVSKTGTSLRSYLPTQTAYIAILRDPSSELVYIAPLAQFANLTTGTYPLTSTGVENYENTKGQICLSHQGIFSPKSYLRFNGGSGIGSIEVLTEPLLTGPGVPTC
jgi:type II secretory pathway pseudopilin PulG